MPTFKTSEELLQVIEKKGVFSLVSFFDSTFAAETVVGSVNCLPKTATAVVSGTMMTAETVARAQEMS